MATYFGDDVTLRTKAPRTVGEATVWPVESIDVTGDRIMGKVVLRDGFWFIRDCTSCGRPIVVGADRATLTEILWLASRRLLAA